MVAQALRKRVTSASPAKKKITMPIHQEGADKKGSAISKKGPAAKGGAANVDTSLGTPQGRETSRLREREENALLLAQKLNETIQDECQNLRMERNALREQLDKERTNVGLLKKQLQLNLEREQKIIKSHTKMEEQMSSMLAHNSRAMSDLVGSDDGQESDIQKLKSKVAHLESESAKKEKEIEDLSAALKRCTEKSMALDADVHQGVAVELTRLSGSLKDIISNVMSRLESIEQKASCDTAAVDDVQAFLEEQKELILAGSGGVAAKNFLLYRENRLAQRQENYNAAINLKSTLDEYSTAYLRELRALKLQLSSIPDVLMMSEYGGHVHSRLNDQTKHCLSELSRDKLLVLLDCLSFDGRILNVLNMEIPFHNDDRFIKLGKGVKSGQEEGIPSPISSKEVWD